MIWILNGKLFITISVVVFLVVFSCFFNWGKFLCLLIIIVYMKLDEMIKNSFLKECPYVTASLYNLQ